MSPVQDWPLAICDAASVDQADLVPSDIIFSPDSITENFTVHFNSQQRWYWLPNQMDDEALVFKAFDSDFAGGACE